MKQNEIRRLSDVEHVLKRTGRYIGSTKPITQKMFVLREGKMKYEEVTYVPALIKIVREIIDNAVDENARSDGKFANKIRIKVDDTDGSITIRDNGRGIPVTKIDDKTWGPEAAFTELKAGANFDDDADNVTIGQNGEGSSLTCILSKLFKVTTSDGKNKFKMTCKDNLSSKKCDVEPCSEQFTEVSFIPDYPRFNLEKLDQNHIDILLTDLNSLASAYPDIKFTFNDNRINASAFKKYVEMFGDVYEILESDNGNFTLAVLPNIEDDFNFICYVNGVNAYEGGNPLTWACDNVVNGIYDIIGKKHKEMKKGDVRNKLTMIAFFRKMVNPRFDNQTKSRCINTPGEFRDSIGDIDYDKFSKRISKNEVIVSPILDTFRIKEEMKRQAELKNFNKDLTKKKFKFEKYLAPVGDNNYLFLCEGDSAKGGLSAVLGRDGLGYFAMRGVPLNAYDSKTSDLLDNVELKQICQILGLPLGVKHREEAITFKKIVLANDADSDGSHILGLMTGFFQRYAPDLLKNKQVCRIKTPLIVLKKGNVIQEFFFDFNSFNEWQKKHSIGKLQVCYKKGLGSWKKDELQTIIKTVGFENCVEPLTTDEKSDKLIDDWLLGKNVDARKEYLKANSFNIMKV